jgi:hypothetical protein
VCVRHANFIRFAAIDNSLFRGRGTTDPYYSGKGWNLRVDLGAIGKIIYGFRIVFCNVGLAISAHVGWLRSIVENAAQFGG